MAVTGRMGFTKAMKRAARLSTMTTNHKRDKAAQRSTYHREFNNAKGPSPMDPTIAGIIKPPAQIGSQEVTS